MNAATNSTGEYLAMHREIETDCEALSRNEVSLSVLWNDVQCSRDALIRAREELRKATQHVMKATEAWIGAAKDNAPPNLSQQSQMVTV